MINKVFIKKTYLEPYGFRFVIIVDGFKVESWFIGYKASKSTAYRKGFRIVKQFEIFTNDSATSETQKFSNDSATSETQKFSNDSATSETQKFSNDSATSETQKFSNDSVTSETNILKMKL